MPLITISQDFGSFGYHIAKRVAADLHIDLFDDERLRKEAIAMGVSPENVKGLEEKTPGFFDRLLGKKPDIYLDVLQGVVYKISNKGQGVIVGHGSQLLLKDFGCALHVRVTASEKARIKNIMEKRNIGKDIARKIIRRKDEEFEGFFRYAFHKDFNDPLLYDLIINTEKVSVDTAARHIIDLSQSDDIAACSLNALEIMECRALQKKIHAKILQSGISPKVVSVEVTAPESIRVYGVANNKDERQKVVDVLGSIPEAASAEISIVVIPEGS